MSNTCDNIDSMVSRVLIQYNVLARETPLSRSRRRKLVLSHTSAGCLEWTDPALGMHEATFS